MSPYPPVLPFRLLLSGTRAAFFAACTLLGSSAVAADSSDSKPIFGVYVGNDVKDVRQYEQWLGKPTEAILGYTGAANWQDYEGSVGWAMGLWAEIDRPVLWSVPLIPKGATLEEAAKGTYNDHYQHVAEKLAKWRPNEPVIYLRTAWEFNGDWFPCSAIGKAELFIGAWRQFVTVFRKASDRFRFDWCPAGGDHMKMKAEEAYPGDNYVDIIGLDIYDSEKWNKVKDPVERWNKIYLTGENGLEWHRNFAKQRGKPMSYPEWGVGGNESGDDPYFVEKMHAWFLENHVVYATYWNSNADYSGKLSDGQYPQSGAKFKELFGK